MISFRHPEFEGLDVPDAVLPLFLDLHLLFLNLRDVLLFCRVTCLHGGNGHGCGGEVVGYGRGKVITARFATDLTDPI